MSDPQQPSGNDDKTVEQPAVGSDETAKNEKPAETRATETLPAEDQPAEDQTAEHPAAAPQPATSQPATPAGPPVGAPQWVPPQQAASKKGGFRRFAGHRATQLVGVGLLGFILGGGIIGTAVGFAARDGGGRHGDRPGFSREHRGPDGQGGPASPRDFRDGPGWRDGT